MWVAKTKVLIFHKSWNLLSFSIIVFPIFTNDLISSTTSYFQYLCLFSTANLSLPWRLDMWRFKSRVHTFIQLQVDNPWFDFTRRWIFKLIVSTTVITSAIPRLCWRLLMKIVRRFKYRYMKIILYINVTSGRFWIRFVFQKVVGDVCFIRIGP